MYTDQWIEAVPNRKVYLHQWTPDTTPIGTIVLIHGMGEHAGRYHTLANFLNTQGYMVLAPDLYGHGKTPGRRGHTHRMTDYHDLIMHVVGMACNLPYPVFVYGHSMGGCLVLHTLFFGNLHVNGLIASAPAIAPAFKVPFFKKLFGRIAKWLFPSLTLSNGLNVDGISRDPQVVTDYQADILTHDRISAEVGIALIDWGNQLSKTDRVDHTVPLLIMHGDADILTSHDRSYAFTTKLKGDAVFKSWQGLFHELHNEPEKEDVYRYVDQWLDAHNPLKSTKNS